MELCIFSGTFNPIHNGHLYMAEYVIKHFGIPKILFIPAFVPPMKDTPKELANHRYKMTELAIKNNPHFEISDIEFRHSGKSYTYLTIKELYEIYQIDGKINIIIGTDAFEGLDRWYESEKLRKLVRFIVFVRKNDFDITKYDNMKTKGYDFKFARMQFNDISSTGIRNMIKNNQDLSGLLPEEVERYIKENGLYKN